MTDSLERAIGRLEGKVDQILVGLNSHEERLSKVEKWQSKLAGGLALAAFVVGVVVKTLL